MRPAVFGGEYKTTPCNWYPVLLKRWQITHPRDLGLIQDTPTTRNVRHVKNLSATNFPLAVWSFSCWFRTSNYGQRQWHWSPSFFLGIPSFLVFPVTKWKQNVFGLHWGRLRIAWDRFGMILKWSWNRTEFALESYRSDTEPHFSADRWMQCTAVHTMHGLRLTNLD